MLPFLFETSQMWIVPHRSVGTEDGWYRAGQDIYICIYIQKLRVYSNGQVP